VTSHYHRFPSPRRGIQALDLNISGVAGSVALQTGFGPQKKQVHASTGQLQSAPGVMSSLTPPITPRMDLSGSSLASTPRDANASRNSTDREVAALPARRDKACTVIYQAAAPALTIQPRTLRTGAGMDVLLSPDLSPDSHSVNLRNHA
jgi:hypothetical protein